MIDKLFIIISVIVLFSCAPVSTIHHRSTDLQIYQERIFNSTGEKIGQRERRVFSNKEEVLILDDYGRIKYKYTIRSNQLKGPQ